MKLKIKMPEKMLEIETGRVDAIVGRSPGCDLVIPHDSISRNHCRVEALDDEFMITDLGSSNGTFINGDKIEPHKRVSFHPQAKITIGRLDCEFSFSSLAYDDGARARAEAIKAAINKNATSTVKIRSIELNENESIVERERKSVLQGPRNPITDGIVAEVKAEYKTPRMKYIFLFLLLALVNYFLINVAIIK